MVEEIEGVVKETVPEKEIEKRKKKMKDKLFSWITDNYDKFFILVLIAAVIIRLVIFFETTTQPLWYDEASYLMAGKIWGLGLHVRDIWYYRRGFLFPLICAAFFKFGLGEISIRFFDVLLSVGFVFISYFIIRDMFDKKIALLSCIGLTFSWILLFFTGRILTDIPSAFFILLSLFCFWRGYVMKKGNKFIYLFAFFLACGVLIRMQSLMMIPPFLIMIFVKERGKMFKNKSLWIAVGIFALIMLPEVILYTMHYGNPVQDILAHYFGIGSAPNTATGTNSIALMFNYFLDLPYMMSTSIFILLIIGAGFFLLDVILGFDQLFKNKELQNKFFVICWILSLFLIMGYIGSVDYVEERYITVGLPFLFLLASVPLIKISEFIVKKFKIKEFSSIILVSIILIILLIANIFGASNYTTAFGLLENKKTSYFEVQEAGLWLKANSNPTDIILSNSQTQIEYYSERSVYTLPELGGPNGTYFQENIMKMKPAYLMLSVFEQHDPWMYAYPSEHNDTVIPVQAYQENGQPVVVIYKFKY